LSPSKINKTSICHPGLDPGSRPTCRLRTSFVKTPWIPAFAGMTKEFYTTRMMVVFAGMTSFYGYIIIDDFVNTAKLIICHLERRERS